MCNALQSHRSAFGSTHTSPRRAQSSTKLPTKVTSLRSPTEVCGSMISGYVPMPSFRVLPEANQISIQQAGMGFIDFTNPDACKWYQDKLQALVDMGVDSFKVTRPFCDSIRASSHQFPCRPTSVSGFPRAMLSITTDPAPRKCTTTTPSFTTRSRLRSLRRISASTRPPFSHAPPPQGANASPYTGAATHTAPLKQWPRRCVVA